VEKYSTSRLSPLSPTLWPADAFSLVRVALMLLGIVGAGAAGLILSIVFIRVSGMPLFGPNKQPQLNAAFLLLQTVTFVFALTATLVSLPHVARRSLAELGLRRPRLSDAGAAVIGAVAMFAVVELAAIAQKFFLHIDGTQQDIQIFSTAHDPRLIASFIVLAVGLAPVVEETIFRGFLLNALLRWMPPVIAIILTGVLFGAAHGDRVALFPLACGGIVLATVYYRTGSLVASMATHGLFNAISVVLFLAGGGKGA
jgi:membrane protease YdiL (CAAX protease family)